MKDLPTEAVGATADSAPAEDGVAAPRRPRRDTVTDVFDDLRARILDGTLAPGTELSQVQLARELGVSTTPLREALRRLEAEELVEARRNRRPRVPPFEVTDVDNLYCSRVLVESLAISLAVPMMSAEDLEVSRTLLAEMNAAAEQNDSAAWDQVHARFHRQLVSRCSEPMRRQTESLMARSDRYRRMSIAANQAAGGRSTGAAEHGAILAACEAGDGAEAAHLLARHLAQSAIVVVAHFAPDADPLYVRRALQMVMSWGVSERSESA
jgi:DNA-binding GntR family transcriptional regulator